MSKRIAAILFIAVSFCVSAFVAEAQMTDEAACCPAVWALFGKEYWEKLKKDL